MLVGNFSKYLYNIYILGFLRENPFHKYKKFMFEGDRISFF